MLGKKRKNEKRVEVVGESLELKKQRLVDSVNIIRESGNKVGYILGSTILPNMDGRIGFIEDMGSSHTNHFAYMTKDGRYHLDTELKYKDDNGRVKDVFRRRVFTKVGGEWICNTDELPRSEAFGLAIEADNVEGGIVRSFFTDADLSGTRKPIKAWQPGIDPRLPIDALEAITVEDEFAMTIVDRVLKITDSVQHHDLGRMSVDAVFRGAA